MIATAWDAIHEAKPEGWFVGRPMYLKGDGHWVQYAFDSRERARAGHRTREWTAVAPSEADVLEEMARCLAIIAGGGWPR